MQQRSCGVWSSTFGQVSDKSNQDDKSLRLFLSTELLVYIFYVENDITSGNSVQGKGLS